MRSCICTACESRRFNLGLQGVYLAPIQDSANKSQQSTSRHALCKGTTCRQPDRFRSLHGTEALTERHLNKAALPTAWARPVSQQLILSSSTTIKALEIAILRMYKIVLASSRQEDASSSANLRTKEAARNAMYLHS